MYEPSLARLLVVRSRISAKSWQARVVAARQSAKVLARIAGCVAKGMALNEAIRRTVPESRRSWVYRHWKAFHGDGMEGLVDGRLPRTPSLSRHGERLVEALREANPHITALAALQILSRQGVSVLPTEATIERCFRRVDARLRCAKKKSEPGGVEVVELPLSGGELLLAAELETHAIGALTDVVEEMGAEARRDSVGLTHVPDVANRNKLGQFTSRYNQARRRKTGEDVASYLRPAEEKRVGRIAAWARFTHERRETLEPKMANLTLAPLVSDTKGWEALRCERAAGLGPLIGFAYMHSTVAKFTSALAINDAGPRLLEAVGVNWHRVAQERWGENGAMAALYVDNHAKEVWSSLFTMSGKVSHLSRVMPCITTTYVHTGAGTPLVASVQSGAAPLAPRLIDIVEDAEATLGGEVERAVVIDAEGSTFDTLLTFSQRGRVIVTPLRPSRAPELELTFGPGSYFRPYRDHDEIRVAEATLTHKSTGRSLDVGAVIIRREHRESDTVLLTTGIGRELTGRELANLYFQRWPIQENAFKDGAVAALNEHHGNCGSMVTNVAVETELDKLARRDAKIQAERTALADKQPHLAKKLDDARREHRHATTALATRRRRLDTVLDQGRSSARKLGQVALDHRAAIDREGAARVRLDAAEHAANITATRAQKLDADLAKTADRRAHLEPQRKIRQIDVALDTIMTAAKLTLMLLITFVLREYLSCLAMSPATFASRVFGLSGRREVHATDEYIVFYENPRDPPVNLALAEACRVLNQRGLHRDDRLLHYAVEARKPDT